MNGECKVTVDPGVCKLKTTIVAKMDMDTMEVKYEIDTDCPSIKKLAANIGGVNPYTEMGGKFCDSVIYKTCNDYVPHLACPVPCAIVKATEVAGGLGLKRDVLLKIQ